MVMADEDRDFAIPAKHWNAQQLRGGRNDSGPVLPLAFALKCILSRTLHFGRFIRISRDCL